MPMLAVNFKFPLELLERIDVVAGKRARSEFVRQAVEERLARLERPVPREELVREELARRPSRPPRRVAS